MRPTKPPRALTIRNNFELLMLIEILDAALQRSDFSGKRKSTVDRWTSQLRSTARKSGVEPELPIANGSKTSTPNESPNVFSLAGHPHVPACEATTIQNIFDHWRDVMAKPRARLDDKRRNLIRRRLRESFSEAELRAAIDGCRASPWHQGENESGTRYVELSLVFRNAEKIERFCELAESPPRPRPAPRSAQAANDARIAWRNVLAHVRAGKHRRGESLGGPIDPAVNRIGGYSAVGMATERQLFDLERRFVESFIEVVATGKDKSRLQPVNKHAERRS